MNIDTNILIAFITGDEAVVSFISSCRIQGLYLYISTVTETEVLAFSGWNDAERTFVKNFLNQGFVIVPFAENLVDSTASLRRTTKLKLPDAIIAATALHTATPLLTRNTKDFRKVRGLKLMSV